MGKRTHDLESESEEEELERKVYKSTETPSVPSFPPLLRHQAHRTTTLGRSSLARCRQRAPSRPRSTKPQNRSMRIIQLTTPSSVALNSTTWNAGESSRTNASSNCISTKFTTRSLKSRKIVERRLYVLAPPLHASELTRIETVRLSPSQLHSVLLHAKNSSLAFGRCTSIPPSVLLRRHAMGCGRRTEEGRWDGAQGLDAPTE